MSIEINSFAVTGIGSVPHKDPVSACELILSATDIPFWPQLPNLSFKESMLVQYSEGMPFVQVDEKNQSVFIRASNSSDELTRFYESMTEDAKSAISEHFAKGFYTFMSILKGRRLPFVKGHITGPLTFTLGIKDERGRFIYFDEELREIALLLLQAKARWQIDMLRKVAENVIIFIDEPILSAIGSTAYLGVSDDEILRLLSHVTEAINSSGAISGIHCCGKADWGIVLKTGVQIANFDAWQYFDAFMLYKNDISEFLQRGGRIAWGIIPTSGDSTEEVLFQKMQEAIFEMATFADIAKLKSNSLITPACGTGSRTLQEAIKVFQLAIRLKEALQCL